MNKLTLIQLIREEVKKLILSEQYIPTKTTITLNTKKVINLD